MKIMTKRPHLWCVEVPEKVLLQSAEHLKVSVVISDVHLAHKLPRKHTNKLKPSSSNFSSSERAERSEAECDASGFESIIPSNSKVSHRVEKMAKLNSSICVFQ
jgi:hypothetical protein